MNNISSDIPDWTREKLGSFWSPSKKLLCAVGHES